MEVLILYYTSSLVIIGLIMQIIVKIDAVMDSWSLADKFKFLGFEISLAQIVGGVISAIASVIMTVTAGYPWGYAIAGFVAIFFSQYGASKLGWKKVFEIIVNVAKAFGKKKGG